LRFAQPHVIGAVDDRAYSFVMSNKPNSASVDGSSAGGVQSVDRAISVLEILARSGDAGVSEVAAEIDVHKSTAFRLLGALESRGLVEQAGDRGKYRLGFGIVRLAGAVTGRLDVSRQGRPVLERLAEDFGETANLAVLQQHYAVNLDEVRGASAVTVQNWVGQLTPLHATSSGKVLLAHLSKPARTKLVAAAGLERLTPNTVTVRARLERELAEVRDRGFALAVEEYEVGLNAMAAPVRSGTGAVVAALSCSGPAYRLTEDRMRDQSPALVAAADELSRRLGHLG
jgi:DNA-binding IclR family transcriptional regulator